MTVAKALGLQTDVYNAVVAGVAAWSIPVFDRAPVGPFDEFIRLDGFTVTAMPRKRGEIARHAFEVHHFLAPVGASTITRGQTRSKTVLAAVHVAILAASLQGTSAEHEYMSVDPDMDGVTTHGISRYTIVLV